MEEGNLAAVLPVLEEGESKDATIARLEREKEAVSEEKEEETRRREAVEAELRELKKHV